MNPRTGKESTSPSRPTVSALLQEALDTPLNRLTINDHQQHTNTLFPLPLSSPPLAHIDQNQHPHHHSQTPSIAPPVRYTAEPEPIQTSDTMPIVRSGGTSVPKLARLMSKSGPVSGVTGALNAVSSVAGASHYTSSFQQASSNSSPQRQVPTSPPSRRPSDAYSMRDEVTKLRTRSGHAQDHTGNVAISTNPVDGAKRNRDSLDDVRIGGQPFSSLVASNPFQEETNPFKSLISNDPFQKDSRPKEQQHSGRPKMRHRSSSTSRLPTAPRHLQRTISSLLNKKDGTTNLQSQYPPDPRGSSSSLPRSASFASLTFPSYISLPKTKLPTFPSFPNVPKSALGNVRAFSASARDDKSMWKTWWEGSAVLDDGTERDPKAREHAHKHMLDDADKGETLEEEKEIIKRKYETPKNPIVFCHGLLGWDQLGPKALPALQISHWRGISQVLQENGAEIMIAKVPATSSAAQRAEILLTAIEEKFPGREVNLVGHSMGGLDGRYLISKLKPKTFKVISLTTISTPHRGSPFADYFIDNIIGRERLPSWLTVLDTVSFGAAGDGSAFQALTTRSMALFNEQVPDDPKVKYYSWGASYEPGWFDPLRWSYEIIKALEGENDGLVSVASSKWGEFRGVLVGCSHVDLVGWVNHVRFTMEAWAGRPIAFKPATFYLEITDHLAKQGF